MCCKHIGDKYVCIHNACKAHPTTSKLLDDLYVGHKIKAEAAIGFGNSGAEDTQRFQLLDKLKRIGIAILEVVPVAHELEHSDTYPLELIEKLKTRGVFSATIPEAYGGLGFGFVTYVHVVEELTRV